MSKYSISKPVTTPDTVSDSTQDTVSDSTQDTFSESKPKNVSSISGGIKKVTFNMNADVHRQFKLKCVELEVDMSYIVNKLVQEWLLYS